MHEQTGTKAGYIAIVGRPNVGKSTLLNHIMEQKISITSRKPQTTRHNILGIKTEGSVQLMFVDTPGIHRGQDKAINRYMNRAATAATKDVDLIIFVVDKTHWTEEEESIAERLIHAEAPIIVAVNKVDQIDDKTLLIPHLQTIADKLQPVEIVPISALKGHNLEALEQEIIKRMPEAPHLFPPDQITDRSSRFMAAEVVREKITRQLGAELPYQITVEVEEFKDEGGILHISAVILVERSGQKRILIGDKGARIKSIGQQARLDLEKMFEAKIMLNLWVKVKSGWSDDDRALRSLGYRDMD
jgi:GTP-binding protein Era